MKAPLLRRLAGHLTRWLFPGFGCCRHCRRPWPVVQEHTTWYTPSDGCFALCEPCWAELSVLDRVGYYAQLRKRTPEEWALIRKAVLEGK